MNPDDKTLADIRRWYAENGVPFIYEDWGLRDENGESAGQQRERPEQHRDGSARHTTRPHDPLELWWWEKQAFPWAGRTPTDQEWVELLDDFFAPYLAMLPRAKGNLVYQAYGDLATYREVGESEHVSRQAAHQAVTRAVQDLTRTIAQDDPWYRPPADGRRRDYDEETRAARRVFVIYLERRKLRGQ